MWQPDYDETIRKNYKQPGGLTSRALACKLGVSQAAIMRRASVLGLTDNRSANQRRTMTPISQPPDPADRSTGVKGKSEFDLRGEIRPIRMPRRKRAMAIALQSTSPFRTCQWINNDPYHDNTMCGDPTHAGTSWCKAHHQRVYVTPGAKAADEARAEG